MSINYVQTVEQTHEEKVKMYMKLSKKELVAMLIEANRCLEMRPILAHQYCHSNST